MTGTTVQLSPGQQTAKNASIRCDCTCTRSRATAWRSRYGSGKSFVRWLLYVFLSNMACRYSQILAAFAMHRSSSESTIHAKRRCNFDFCACHRPRQDRDLWVTIHEPRSAGRMRSTHTFLSWATAWNPLLPEGSFGVSPEHEFP